MYTRLTI